MNNQTNLIQKLLLSGLMLSPSLCYLEWPGSHTAFLYEIEYMIFFKGKHSAETMTHPVVLLPLIAQLTLFLCLFLHKPKQVIITIAILILSLLVCLILLVGILGQNQKIIISTLPFLSVQLMYIVFRIRTRNQKR